MHLHIEPTSSKEFRTRNERVTLMEVGKYLEDGAQACHRVHRRSVPCDDRAPHRR